MIEIKPWNWGLRFWNTPLIWYRISNQVEDIPLVEFMSLAFTRMPGESYCRRLRSVLLRLCDVVQALTTPLCVWSFQSKFESELNVAKHPANTSVEHSWGGGVLPLKNKLLLVLSVTWSWSVSQRDCTVVKAVPPHCGEWEERVVLGSVLVSQESSIPLWCMGRKNCTGQCVGQWFHSTVVSG